MNETLRTARLTELRGLVWRCLMGHLVITSEAGNFSAWLTDNGVDFQELYRRSGPPSPRSALDVQRAARSWGESLIDRVTR